MSNFARTKIEGFDYLHQYDARSTKVRCPNLACRSWQTHIQRTISPVTAGHAYPQRFAGLNGLVRRRICEKCNHHWLTLEVSEIELQAIARRGSILPVGGNG